MTDEHVRSRLSFAAVVTEWTRLPPVGFPKASSQSSHICTTFDPINRLVERDRRVWTVLILRDLPSVDQQKECICPALTTSTLTTVDSGELFSFISRPRIGNQAISLFTGQVRNRQQYHYNGTSSSFVNSILGAPQDSRFSPFLISA